MTPSGDRRSGPWSPSLAAVVVAAFWAIAVVPAVTLPLTDPDTWWHIRAGREVLAAAAVPNVDTWSIAGDGRAWTSQDWLSNVAMAITYGIGPWGPTLLSVLYGVIGLASIWLLWDAIGVRRPSIGWLARPAWLLLGLVLAAPVVGVRVQVVDLLFTAAVVNLLFRFLVHRRSGVLLLLPVIAVAWVNLHAGFPLLFLVGGAVVVGEAVDRLLKRRAHGIPLEWPQIAQLVAALAVSGVVLVVNPNGVAIYRYPFETLGITGLSAFVGEWQPASLDAPAGQLLALFVVMGVLPALLLGGSRTRSGDGLVLIGLTFMAVTAVRFLLVAGPVGAAIACLTLAPILSASRLGRPSARVLDRLTRPRSGPGVAILLIGVVMVGVTLTAVRIAPAGQAAAVRETYPVAAVDWLAANEPGDRIFNKYEWGGYLGLRLPERPIFIDGRADVYGDAILREYVETISVTGDPQETFDRYDVDHVLYPRDSPLGDWLAASEAWEEVFEGEVASIWISR